VKLVSLIGVIVRLDNVQPMMSTEVLPAVAVNVWPASSLSVAPTGMLPMTSAKSVLSPLAEAVICNGIDVPSTPSTPTAAAVGASGSTITVSVVLAVPVCPPLSVDAAVTVNVKLAAVVGVIVRLDSVQPVMSTEAFRAVAVKVWPAPSLSVAPTGMLPITSDDSVPPLAAAVSSRGIGVPSTPWTGCAVRVGGKDGSSGRTGSSANGTSAGSTGSRLIFMIGTPFPYCWKSSGDAESPGGVPDPCDPFPWKNASCCQSRKVPYASS
jgi:hypothetical protein